MTKNQKISGGMNDRPQHDPMDQSGAGFPDDSSRPIEADDATIGRVREDLSGGSARERLKEEVLEEFEKPQRGSA